MVICMVTGILPDDGPAQVGPVRLPAGRRRYSEDDDQLVAWATDDPMPDAGRAWFALSAAHAETGLVPVLLEPAPPAGEGDWQQPHFGFYLPADVALMDQMSAEKVLARDWSQKFYALEDLPYLAPFGERFPGLAAAEGERLPAAELQRAVSALPPAHLGLVSASRPADVPAIVGWSVFGVDFFNWDEPPDSPAQAEASLAGARSLVIGTVLRSWEARFGARLLRIGGDATLQALVERPPRTLELARQVAAEQYAFADEVHLGAGSEEVGTTVLEIAAALVGAPIWQFWWD